MKNVKIIFLVISFLQVGCSLAPSAASISQKLYNAGEYAKSIRKANYALSTYEYNAEEKANLVFLKAKSYAKLEQYTDAFGTIQYLMQSYPETEAFYRAKALMSSISQHMKPQSSTPQSHNRPPTHTNI
ncbi:hypothetical protein L0668_12415 [Paraglaciecola aquimarina]|uniref:Outer membrane lipoprotein BamD-like domain-containing protein n=1 Tax=Paraglaciecola algarum TaxID=3050085 RepID=A0ABS9D7I7_9ALTE|nr:hypothetical protein [Paraglaciecola sp. G1-23]MCF2948916.1 hypothetical protein [Paraglaciecola sp. G1-23]